MPVKAPTIFGVFSSVLYHTLHWPSCSGRWRDLRKSQPLCPQRARRPVRGATGYTALGNVAAEIAWTARRSKSPVSGAWRPSTTPWSGPSAQREAHRSPSAGYFFGGHLLNYLSPLNLKEL